VNHLHGKKILIGITGSIAAYKIASLVRLFKKAGAEVRVIMTPAATAFITPLTLSTLSGNDVLTAVIDTDNWNNHVELGLWADAYIIAPATANTIAKMANGQCDNLLLAAYLSARCPVYVAPAMDLDMYAHPTTRTNLERLESFGHRIIPAEEGELASGLIGQGRMAEPEHIFDFIEETFRSGGSLAGKNILMTAGPTYEPIDPVRFIGNRSSGKMGMALAEAAANRGANVSLVLGPSAQDSRHPNVTIYRVQTAQEMHEQATALFPECDAAILAAAVADYRPKTAADKKIKKQNNNLTIELVENPDIAQTLGKMKKANQRLVGFALETNDEIANARKKIQKKNFDFIVLNSLKDKNAGFNFDTNKITIIHSDNNTQEFELKSKKKVAEDIIEVLVGIL